jgi:hypothetical protein
VIAANVIDGGGLCGVIDLAFGALAHQEHAMNHPFLLA